MKLKFPKLKIKHKVNIIKILSFAPFLLTLLYTLTSYNKTPKYKLIWWPHLKGFFNNSDIISQDIEGFSILFIIILLIILALRQGIKCFEFKNSPQRYLPVIISYTVSDIIDIISFFVFINLAIDMHYNDSSSIILFLLIITGISIIVYKIIEITNSNPDNNNNNNGALNLHKSTRNYLYNLFPYLNKKTQLQKNYNKIIK